MPQGSELSSSFRNPWGYDSKNNTPVLYQKARVAVYSYSHTQFYLSAYQTLPKLSFLVFLHSSGIGLKGFTFCHTGGSDIRQDCQYFDQNQVLKVKQLLKNILTIAFCIILAIIVLNIYALLPEIFKPLGAPLPTSPYYNCQCVGVFQATPRNRGSFGSKSHCLYS